MDRFKQLFQPRLERLDEIPIGAGEKGVGELDDRHLRAQLGIDSAHLQADVPATDDEERVGDLLELERRGRIHHPGRGQRESWDPGRPRSTRQDAVVERHRLAAVGTGNLERSRRDETGRPVDDPDLAPLRELAEPPAERRNHFLLASPEVVELDLRLAEVDPPGLHLPRFRQHPADMKEGLGGNATPQQAGTAEAILLLDDRHLHAEIGREERRGIPTGAPSENHQWNVRRHRLGLQYG